MANHGGFPDNLLPECWSNDVRMAVLFSPFRERQVNPENYDGKLKFWKDMISRYCHWLGSAEVTMQDIENAFWREDKKPHCIRKVFEEMLLAGELMSREDFMEPPQHTWIGWTANLVVKKPLTWGVKTVKNSLFGPNFSDITFVVQEVVENQSEKLQKLLENQVVSDTEVIRKAGEMLKMSPDGVSLALHALLCQQRVAIRSDFLKFAASGKKVQKISDLEYSIGQLELMEQKLTRLIDSLEEEVKGKEEKAREYVRKSNKKLAKLCLLERNSLMKKLDQHTNARINIQEMLSKINNVSVTKEILQAYKVGDRALKGALKKSGITVEMVEQTMEEMQDAIDLSNDVEAALGTDLAATDTAELERELHDLLERDEQEENVGQDEDLLRRLDALQIPDNSPSPKKPGETETSQY